MALAFGREGADVAVNFPTDGERPAAEDVVAALRTMGRKAVASRADISDENDVVRLVQETAMGLGGIDILVNNAGIADSAPVHEMPVAVWDRMIKVHLRGTFLMIRAVLPIFYGQAYGRIVNTVSQLAYAGAPGFTHYTAAKAGVLGLSRSLTKEIGNRNITVNCVGPGATRTSILDFLPKAALEEILAGIPRGQFAEPEEIAPAYVFLASDEAVHMRGQCISPNGGDVFL